MTIDPHRGDFAFPEFGLTVGPSLTRSGFLRAPTGAVALPRLRHDPSFRYQLPAVPQPDSTLYVVLQFDYERLAAIRLLHEAERFHACETARKNFQEHWLAQSGLACGRYRWGTVSSDHDPSSILIEYVKPNAWRTVGRTAGRWWGAASSKG